MPKLDDEVLSKPFGTIIVDPPWPYGTTGDSHHGGRGYSDKHYEPLSYEDLSGLRLGLLANYMFLWTTPAFDGTGVAVKLANDWGFEVITTLYWVKVNSIERGKEIIFKPNYGVGYWFRGCVEPILVCKSEGVRSVRTPWLGIISPNGRHSRKPDTLYEIVESCFPGPYCEMFARRKRDGWICVGNEAPGDGKDIRVSLKRFL